MFIILMFCLAPLSALDLNAEDNNTKCDDKSIDGNIKVDDTNITTDDDNSQTKNVDDDSAADDSDTQVQDNDDGIKDIKSDKPLKSSEKVSAHLVDPNLAISIEDIYQGEDAIVKVTANSSFSQIVEVKLHTGESCIVRVSEGYGEGSISGLNPNTYSATVSSAADATFYADEATTTFIVKAKVDPKLSIKVNNVTQGEKPVARITANNTLNGNVVVKINSSGNEYTVKLSNGAVNATIFENLAPGNYSATVSYAGDNVFKPAEKTAKFSVKAGELADPNLSISVADITQGNKVVAEINADSSFTNYVDVKLNNSEDSHAVKVTDGKGKITISDNLEPGEYTATVSFNGDSTFKESENSTTFSVKAGELADPNLSISVADITVGSKAVVEVTANNTLNNYVEVKLNGSDTVYPLKVSDGSGRITIDDDLAVGDYLATVSYSGDSTFKADEKNTTFTVKDKVNPKLSIKVSNITRGEKAVAKISANKTLNGNVVVKLNSSDYEYLVNLVDGAGNVTIIEDLAPGNYTATVSFKGDDTFKESSKSTNFAVNEKDLDDPKISISVADINKGENAVAVIKADSGLTGFMDVQLNNSDNIYPVKVTDGAGNVTISRNLAPGKYNATVKFDGDKTYKPGESSTAFTVKENPDLSIKVRNISYGQKALVQITANDTFNHYVEVKLNNSNSPYTVKITDGLGNITIPDTLPAGQYLATVKYDGDDTFMAGESSTEFTVKDRGIVDPNLRISVANINKGEKAVAEIHANSTLNGFMDVQLNSSETVYTVKVTNGVGNVTITENLAPGKYHATVRFDGDNIFKASENGTDFTVKEEPNLSISVADVTQGEEAIVEVTANETFTNYVVVKLNNSDDEHPLKVVGGYGKVVITDDLAPGNYTATVSYGGDDTFMAGENTTTFTVMRYSPNLSIKVDNVTKGDSVFAEINANNTLNGLVEIKLNSSDKSYYTRVSNGYGNLTIDEALEIGSYSATVIFNGDATFRAEENTTTFSVNPRGLADPNISIDVPNINKGEKAVATVHANNTLTGVMEVKLNSSDKIYPVQVENGAGTVTITDDLPAGKYLASVSYVGDDTFKAGENNTEFTVRENPDLTITVADITQGEEPVAIVHANETFNNYVTVKLNGSTVNHTVKLVDGVGNVTITDNLNPGNYTASVSFAGNDTFMSGEASTTFNVLRYSPGLSISVEDVYVGDDAVAIIKANESLNGLVEVKLNNTDDSSYTKVSGGQGNVTIKDLPYGDYTATVIFNGDATFRAEENSTTFTVHRYNPNLSVKVNDINVGDKAVAIVNANTSLSGPVEVKLNSSSTPYTIDLVNGVGNVTITEDLAAGDYLATANFAGDDRFLPDEKTGAFVVNKNKANLMIKVKDIHVGENAVAVITADSRLNGAVNINLNNSNAAYTAKLVNGSGNVTITDDLSADTYLATASFAGDAMFLDDEASTTFDVKKNDPTLNVKVSDIIETEKLTVEVNADSRLNGNVEVKLNNSDNSYSVKVVNGTAKTTLDEVFTPGKYSVTVSFNGDETFLAGEKTAAFTVKDKASVLIDPSLNVKVKDIAYGAKAVVSLTTNKRFTGKVNLAIGSKKYSVKVVEGKGSVSVPNLSVGTHTVKATFKQDAVFKASNKSATFTVNKGTPTITAKAKAFKDTTKTKKYSVSLKNKGKAVSNKKLTLKINGKTYSAKTNAKGVATFKISKLTKVGTKTARVTFAGNKYYNKVSAKSKIRVKFATVAKGSKRKAMVKKIQRALKKNKFYLTYKGKNLNVDGIYHIYTQMSVKQFQKAKKLKVSGKVDEKTAKKLKIV